MPPTDNNKLDQWSKLIQRKDAAAKQVHADLNKKRVAVLKGLEFKHNSMLAVSPSVRTMILEMVGGVPQDARLVAYILNTNRYDKETGWVIVGHADVCWAHEVSWNHKKGSGARLRELCSTLGIDYETSVSEYQHKLEGNTENKHRLIDPAFLGELRDYRFKTITDAHREGWVDMVSGQPWVAVKEPLRQGVNKHQQNVLDCMRAVHKEIYDPDFETLIKHVVEQVGPSARLIAEANLCQLLTKGCPNYGPTERRMTERVFDDLYSSLPGDFRAAAWPDAVELDLSACHLGAFVKIVEDNCGADAAVVRVKARLTHTWFWDELLHDLQRKLSSPACSPRLFSQDQPADIVQQSTKTVSQPTTQSQLTKGLLKELTYAMVNGQGSGLRIASWDLQKHGKLKGFVGHLLDNGFSPENISAISAHQFFEDLWKLRTGLIKHIDKTKRLTDAHDKKLKLRDHEDKALTLMAKVFSSYETALLAPAIEVVRNAPGAYIMFWQHDGIALRHTDPSKMSALVELVILKVNEECRSRGVLTSLIQKK